MCSFGSCQYGDIADLVDELNMDSELVGFTPPNQSLPLEEMIFFLRKEILERDWDDEEEDEEEEVKDLLSITTFNDFVTFTKEYNWDLWCLLSFIGTYFNIELETPEESANFICWCYQTGLVNSMYDFGGFDT